MRTLHRLEQLDGVIRLLQVEDPSPNLIPVLLAEDDVGAGGAGAGAGAGVAPLSLVVRVHPPSEAVPDCTAEVNAFLERYLMRRQIADDGSRVVVDHALSRRSQKRRRSSSAAINPEGEENDSARESEEYGANKSNDDEISTSFGVISSDSDSASDSEFGGYNDHESKRKSGSKSHMTPKRARHGDRNREGGVGASDLIKKLRKSGSSHLDKKSVDDPSIFDDAIQFSFGDNESYDLSIILSCVRCHFELLKALHTKNEKSMRRASYHPVEVVTICISEIAPNFSVGYFLKLCGSTVISSLATFCEANPGETFRIINVCLFLNLIEFIHLNFKLQKIRMMLLLRFIMGA
jgi:hypothetical protein